MYMHVLKKPVTSSITSNASDFLHETNESNRTPIITVEYFLKSLIVTFDVLKFTYTTV